MVRRYRPATVTASGAVIPPPVGASGRLYRTVMALAGAGSVNSTYWPGASRTADRPEASAGRVYAVVAGPMTVPVVVACSASCSTKSTVAPRPVTRAGSSAARVTTGAGVLGSDPAWAVPPAATTDSATARAAPAAVLLRTVLLGAML